jgi:hypothetical protein
MGKVTGHRCEWVRSGFYPLFNNSLFDFQSKILWHRLVVLSPVKKLLCFVRTKIIKKAVKSSRS